jgi:hypothetical protein
MKRERYKPLVWRSLVRAVDRFNASGDRQSLLVQRPLNELTLSHRLGYYLEAELRRVHVVTDVGPICVDCEYNQHGQEAKTMYARESEVPTIQRARPRWMPVGQPDQRPFDVKPDIIVQERRNKYGNNLMVIEVKKESSTEEAGYDPLKILKFTRKPAPHGYCYDLGVRIKAFEANARRVSSA